MEINGILLNYEDVQGNFAACFCGECPRTADCLRHIVGRSIPPGPRIGLCVYPQSLAEDGCQYFHQFRVVSEAWGLTPLFKNVLARDVPVLRSKIMHYLGSKATIFRYNHGINTLSPEQQEHILGILAEMGYDTSDLRFEHYREAIDFHGV